MKKTMQIALSLLLLTTSIARAEHSACLDQAVEEMNALYYTGCDCEDGVFKAVSTSMVAWGIGLFVGIALLTGLIHNSPAKTTSSTSTSSSSSMDLN